jgi:hypothetical protein
MDDRPNSFTTCSKDDDVGAPVDGVDDGYDVDGAMLGIKDALCEGLRDGDETPTTSSAND